MELTQTDQALMQLHPKIQRFVHLYITGQYTLVKLAQLLDVHINTVYGWMKRDDVKEIILDMQKATHNVVATQLKTLTVKAVNKMCDLMDSPIDGVALQAARDILDRAGHKPKQEIKVDKTVMTFEQRLNTLIEETIPDEIIDAEVVDD
jgi:transposase-like protein